MLAEEDVDLKWIAHDLGFFDRSHFSRVVMAEVGLPPHEVRRLLSATGSSKKETRVSDQSFATSIARDV
jgi:AraC-like DNA-binding protein